MSQVPQQEIDGTTVGIRGGSEGRIVFAFGQSGWRLRHLWRPAWAWVVLLAGLRLDLLSTCYAMRYGHNFSS